MKRFLLPVISVLFLMAAFFTSCDVGLGEAVDTEKPTVSIEYPPKNVVIKEDFVISGKCHDETSLKSVTLSFQNSDTKNEYNFTASLSEDRNSWYAEINKFDSENKKYPLPDGTYFVTAVATDGSGKKQEDKSTLRIDNTPPLLVLTNPSTVLDEKTPLESAGGFGATIKLQGSVNDFSVTDNDSGSGLIFTVFDKDDKYLGRREMSNIPPSLGIIIGEYTDSTENLTDANNFYNAIYGESGEVVDTKYRKFKITISDAARTYKGENISVNATERGNTTEYYYLKDEIYTDVINKFSVGYPGVYEIIKKQAEKTSELSENEKNILAALEQFKHESDDEYEDSSADVSRSAATSRALKIKPVGTFSLNPKNNPSYEITSIDAFDSSASKPWEEKSISTSGNITLLAKCGLSDAPLDSATFKVILYKTDENGVRLAATDEDKNEDIEIPCEWSKNGANYTGRVTLSSKYVQVAQFYGIELKGQDKTGLEFYNGSKIYRFLVQTGTTPPDVKIEKYSAPSSGSTVYLKKKDSSTEAVDFVIFGTAESRSGSAKGKVTLWPAINKTEYKDNSFTTTSNTENVWSLTIPGKLFNDEKSDTYTVTIYAHDEIANETSKEIFVIFDKEDPKIQINSVNNVVVFDVDTTINADGKTFEATANRGYVNETITVSGNVSDNDAFASGTWKATCDGKDIASGSLASSQIKFEIDTTKGSDGKDLIITLEVYDRAGNKTSYSYNYDDGKPLVISQLTDYPRINLSNASFDVSDQNDVKIGHNLFDQSGNNRISGSIVDDDGIDSIEIYYSEIGKDDFKPLYNGSLNANGKTSYSINQELKDSSGNVLPEGFYNIKITAKDKKADEKTGTVKTTEITPFVVCINNGAPTITFKNPIKYSDAYQSAEGFMVTGTVTGEFGNSEPITRGDKTISIINGYWSDFVKKDSSGKFSNGIKQDEATGVYTITYSVKDRFERETVDSVTFKIDEEAPKTEISQVSPLVTDYAGTPAEYKNGAVNGTITVQGAASDNDKVVSTVLNIYKAKIDDSRKVPTDGDLIQSLSFDGNEKTGDAISIPNGITNTVNNFKFSVDTKKLAENFDNQGIILKIECKDSSGNCGSDEYPVYVCQDTDIPTLKFNNGDVNCKDEKEIKVGNNLFGMGSNTLYINVTDDDGVESVKYTVDGNEKEKTLLSGGTSTTFSAVIDVSNFGDGIHSLRFKVKDVYEKEQWFPPEKDSSIKIAYDNDIPEISVLNLGDVNYSPNCFAKESFTISGKVKDSSGKVSIYLKDENSETFVATIDCSTEEDWTYDISNKSGDNSRNFVAKDKYGRERILTITYKVDTIPPAFVSNYIYLTGETINGTKEYVLASSDTNNNIYVPENIWFTSSSFSVKGKSVSENKPVNEDNNFEIKLYSGSVTSENLVSTIQPSGNNNFSGTIDVSSEGTSTIILVAVDEAGNTSLPLSIAVNVDKTAPKIDETNIYTENPTETSAPLSSGAFINSNEIFIKYTASDYELGDSTKNGSGIKVVEIFKTAAMQENEKLGTLDKDSGVIKVDISSFASQEYEFYIKATDKAGNSSSAKLNKFTFDNEKPVVAYTKPEPNSYVNKKITIEGTVFDLYSPDTNSDWKWQLKVKKPNGTTFESVDEILFDTTLEVGKFKVSGIDTEKIGEGNAEFIVVATDKAGNTIDESIGKALILNINQNSDRPVIEFNSINTDGTSLLNSGTIAGRITDDDGDVNELWIKTSKDGSYNKLSVVNSTWSYDLPKIGDPASADGNYTLYFKVVDNAGTSFETKDDGSDGIDVPYFQYQNKDKTYSPVKFSVDTTAPKITLVDVSFDGGSNYLNTNIGNNQNFGGKKNKTAIFKIKASDAVTSAQSLIVKLELGSEILLTYNASEDAYFATVDCSLITSGIYQLKVSATDEANMTESFTRSVIVDNSAPDTIKNVSPSSNTEVTGEFIFSGLIQDDEAANSGIQTGKIYYYIPKHEEKDPASIQDSEWTQSNLSQTSVSWSIEFKNLSVLLGYDSTKGTLSSDYDGYRDSERSDLFNIPVWFKAEDISGNVGYITECTYIGKDVKEEIKLKFNPNADKPKAEITYPEHDKTEGSLNYVILGGTVRFAGSSSDNEGIDSVYLQFDMDGDGEYENGMKSDGSMIDGCPYTADKIVTIPVKGEKGVKVERGTISWSHSLDVSNLKGLSWADDKKLLRVRVCAVDNDMIGGQLASAWSEPVCISVNNSVPQISVDKLRQYTSSDTNLESPIKEITYADGDYISGENWYLEGYFEDSDGIDILETYATVSNVRVDGHFEKADISDSEGKKYTFKIPVSSASGSCDIALIVKDRDSSNPQTTERNYTVKIDNTAPDFDEGGGTKLVLYKNNYGVGGIRLDDSSNFIQDSNGSTTIASRIEEADSGFARAVFFFTRNYKTESNSPTRVFNVMEGYGTDRTANRTDIVANKTDGKVYINAEGLAVLYRSTINRPSTNELNFSGLSSNKNIRNAGLIKIGGAYHKILGITGDVLTFENECSEDFTEAEFVYGMVVDNNDNGTVSKDDGDGMAESYSKAGNYYIWDATLNSTNIPDGPITVNVVVFDKAGNFRIGSVETRISNSPVRITSVKLATDLNSNGTFEADEFQQFYAFKNADGSGNTDKGTDVWNLDTKEELYGNSSTGKYWAVRDRLAVVPEFVGGTAPFYWNFTKSETGENLTTANTLTASTAIKIENKEQFSLDNSQINEATGEGKDVTYQFSFWDSTEELTPGSDTSWTVLNAHVKQELSDSVAPTVTIRPFYWNSSSDNSLYKNSKDEGHIELESDLDFAGSAFTQTSGLYDKDPKVSGIIKIQGTANDNKILKDISVKIPGLLDDFTVVGSYTTGSGWNDSSESEVETKLASGSSWAFTVDEETITQEAGHTIKWTLTVDTSKITGVAATDVQVQVKASDQKGNSSTEQTTQTAQDNETSFYKMDVVPYITMVETSLSSKKDTNPSVYSRTSTGKYPVWIYKNSPTYKNGTYETSAETVKLYGFNLEGGAVYDENSKTGSMTKGTRSIKSMTFGDVGTVYYSVPVENFASGKIKVTVNTVDSLNNENSSTAEYNKQSNGDNNLNLQDDVIFEVWQLNATAARPESVGNDVSSVAMAINPNSKMIDFGFSNGSAKMSFANGTANSYQSWKTNWDDIVGNSIVATMAGKTHGTTIGQDTNAVNANNHGESSNLNVLSSNWSPYNLSQASNEYYGYAAIRLEKLGLWGYADSSATSKTQIINKRRIQSPAPVVITHGATDTMYLAYCDIINNQVRFRYGNIQSSKKDDGQLYDFDNSRMIDESPKDYWSVVAGYKQSCAWQANRTLVNSYHSGKFVSIDVVSGSSTSEDVVVLVWYDAEEKKLMYTYKKNPCNDNDSDSSSFNYGSNYTDGTWATPIEIFDGAGEYCKIKVDSNNGIHIAAYDTVNADVVYAYLSDYEQRAVTGSCTVDSTDILGTYITLDVASVSGKQIPYIGYYANSIQKPKFAKLSETAINSYDAGVLDSSYTGNWEVSVVPTISTMVEGSINVGVWKDSSGNLIVSKAEDSYASTSNGVCYGNGTKNAVLGYAITNSSGAGGTIETAQLK